MRVCIVYFVFITLHRIICTYISLHIIQMDRVGSVLFDGKLFAAAVAVE